MPRALIAQRRAVHAEVLFHSSLTSVCAVSVSATLVSSTSSCTALPSGARSPATVSGAGNACRRAGEVHADRCASAPRRPPPAPRRTACRSRDFQPGVSALAMFSASTAERRSSQANRRSARSKNPICVGSTSCLPNRGKPLSRSRIAPRPEQSMNATETRQKAPCAPLAATLPQHLSVWMRPTMDSTAQNEPPFPAADRAAALAECGAPAHCGWRARWSMRIATSTSPARTGNRPPVRRRARPAARPRAGAAPAAGGSAGRVGRPHGRDRRPMRRTAHDRAGIAPRCSAVGTPAGARLCLRRSRSASTSAPAARPGATSRLVQLTALITVLSLAPSLLVMVTAFTRIVVVLSLLRSALGTQGAPPNTVLIGLALFLTLFVMQPVLDQAWTTGLLPMTRGTGRRDGRAAAGRRAVPALHGGQRPAGRPAPVPRSRRHRRTCRRRMTRPGAR